MNARLSNLLDDLRKLSTQDCVDLTTQEANDLYVALEMAGITVRASQIVKGNFDWMDERSLRLANRSY